MNRYGMTPQNALATLYGLREAYVRAVIHLDTPEGDQRFEQSETVHMQAYDALRAPVPIVHGESADGANLIFCHICRLSSARHYQTTVGRFERFFRDACLPPTAATIPGVQSCSAVPETNASAERRP